MHTNTHTRTHTGGFDTLKSYALSMGFGAAVWQVFSCVCVCVYVGAAVAGVCACVRVCRCKGIAAEKRCSATHYAKET